MDEFGRMSATVVVPQSFLDDMVAYAQFEGGMWRWMLRQRSWEERLVEAIAQRSIRNRFRRAREDWTDRLALAADVLRGRHTCDD